MNKQIFKNIFLGVLIVVAITLTIINIQWRPTKTQMDFGEIDLIDKTKVLEVDEIYNGMTEAERKGILFMVGIPDTKLGASTIKFLKDNKIGGVVLLGSNIVNKEQLKQLTTDLREKVNPDMLVAIDQEGGTVVRIPWDPYKEYSARDLGDKNDLEFAFTVAKERAKLLREVGIDIILGPVADIADKDSFMYDRSFSNDPEKVAQYVEQFVKAQKEEKIISVLKHFPGHGKTTTDSHQTFPLIELSGEALEKEMLPFKRGIAAGAELVMMGHIINKNIDTQPSSISKKYIDILENQLGFEGIIITDDLKMTGKIDQSVNWGINLTIEDNQKVLNRINSVKPEEKYVKRLLKLLKERD